MIDRRVPCAGGSRSRISDGAYHTSERPRQSAEKAQHERIARKLQGELFAQMTSDAASFATIMRTHDAVPEHMRVQQDVPRRIPLFGTKTKDVTEAYWLVRGPGQTNYGGFPLFFPAGDDRSMDAFQRIVISEAGQLKRFLSFGEEARPYDVLVTSELAEPDDVIRPWGLRSEKDKRRLYGEWIGDLVTVIHEYTGLVPNAEQAQGNGLVVALPAVTSGITLKKLS